VGWVEDPFVNSSRQSIKGHHFQHLKISLFKSAAMGWCSGYILRKECNYYAKLGGGEKQAH